MTTELLQFDTMHYNVVAAQMSRGKTERATAYAIGAVASTLGRFAMDVCLFINQNFGFISFPDEYTTGSSIMPHKKNPDVFEIMRAKCNRLQSVASEVAMMTTNLPVGYQRDFQLLKDVMFPAIEETKSCLTMCDMMLQHIRINQDILSDPKYDYLFTVEDVNRLALSGVPFREAYRQIGMQVQNHTYKPTREVHHTHEGSIGNLCNDRIREKLLQVMREFD
jgi:argininosuccinate lyase